MRAIFLLFAASACCGAQTVGAITNSADYSGHISPGGLATIFGSGFAASAFPATSIPLSTTLGGVTLVISSYPCPLLFVNATQINFQVPFEVPAGTQEFFLTAPSGDVSGQIQIDEASPALFQYGTNQAVAVDYSTGELNSSDAPVDAGDYLIVYLTGIGPVTSPPADGAGSGSSAATGTVAATIGGMEATVSFLGLVPGLVGLGQANVIAPSLANGNYPLTITVNNVVSPSAMVSVSGTGTVTPTILTFVSSVGVPTQSLQSNVHGSTTVQVNGQYAYVCSASQITAIDVSNVRAPVVAAAFGQTQLNGTGTNCILSNNYLVGIVNAGSYVVWDLTTSPTQPALVSGPTALQVPLAGHLAFDGTKLLLDTSQASWSLSNDAILSESGYLEAYDFSNFTSPVYDSTYVPPSGFTLDDSPRGQIAPITNQYAAMAGTTNAGRGPTDGQGVFDVLDVSNPAGILGVVEVPIPGAVVVQEIALEGSEALVTGTTQAWVNPITYSGSTPEFLSEGDLTLSIVDFSNPQAPNVISTSVTAIQASGEPAVVSLGGGYFAISGLTSYLDFNGAGALAVVNAIDPTNLTWIPIATIDGVSGMYVQSGYLYVATGLGVNVYQISPPPV